MKYTVRFSSANYADHYCSPSWAFYPTALPLPKPVSMNLEDALETVKYLLESGATRMEVEAVK